MKKFALYAGLAILLLLLINIIKPKEEHTGLGSNPGNILNGGYFAEDEEFYYYSTYVDSCRKHRIYKVNKKSLKTTKLATNSLGANFLNVAGKYIYYTEGWPGFIWKMSKNGIYRRPVLLKQVTNVIISGDRIYYRLLPSDGIFLKIEKFADKWGSIYSCDLNGRNKKLISKEEILNFVVDEDKIYYTDHTDNDSVWRMDTSGENKEKLHSKESSELKYCVPNFDEEYLYFTADDCLYRMDKETLEKDILLKDNFADMIVNGDWIFYCTSDERGIYRLSKDGKEKELLVEGKFSGFNVAENALFLYRDGELYHFDVETKELTKISED